MQFKLALFVCCTSILSPVAASAACNNGSDRTRIECLDKELSQLKTQVTPRGAVVFFNAAACPQGWAAFREGAGRFVVGANAVLPVGKTDGTSTVTLSKENLPPIEMRAQVHAIQTLQSEIFAHFQGGMLVLLSHFNETGSNPLQLTANSNGQSTPINIMPPFIALLACVKQ